MRAQASRIHRRTLLRGVGVAMALPWLESLPVWGGEAATGTAPHAFPKRFAALFMGNGINPNHWWAKGAGADMELSQSLQPLAPLKTKLNVISGLFNKHATGVGIHPGQTGNILSGAALQKGAVLKGGVSMDQVLAGRLGEETAQPSLVLGCEQPITGYHETQLLDGLQLAHLLAGRALAGPDGSLSLAGLRQPLRQPGEQAGAQHPRPRQGARRGPEPAGQPCRLRRSSTSTSPASARWRSGSSARVR